MRNDVEDIGVVHGALDYTELRRLNVHPDEVLDFSVNSNPYGPSPHVRTAIAQANLERYPDRECTQLRQAIVQYELRDTAIRFDEVLCGNGSSALIWAIAHAFLRQGDRVALCEPTFGEYAAASCAAGAEIMVWHTTEAQCFQYDIAQLLCWLRKEQPRLLWLCNPNNPTGSNLTPTMIILIAKECSKLGTLLVIDESYLNFVPAEIFFSGIQLRDRSHVLVVRSLTKDYALAGVRLGYVIGQRELLRAVRGQLPSWDVSALAQVAGQAALMDQQHKRETLAQLASERQAFFATLRQAHLTFIPSYTHFCLLKAGNATQVRQQLLARRLLVRDCTSFGLPQFVRVATRPAMEWRRLVTALREVMQAK
ncbi:MAG TPA: histidinol-phosphate transaminase [Dictyobacter sp.]|jgi:histidinol-phosphate aminotransferase|nr:histidinol-phosphate transaminase [Dictyobacter sp.]